MRTRYHSLFDQYGVDLVLNGHSHFYERTYPLLYNKSNPAAPIITEKSTGSYNDPQGEIFITVGTAGASKYNYNKLMYYSAIFSNRYGFLDIDIAGNKLVGTFYINSNSSATDQFSITK